MDLNPPNLDSAALEALLQAAEPGARLAPMWMLRGIVVADCGNAAATYASLRNQAHGIDRQRLLTITEEDERPIGMETLAAADVLLLPEPDAEWLEITPSPAVLLRYWRLLFQGRVYATVRRAVMGLPPAAVQERIEAIGRSAFNDGRFVLQKDRYLAPTADDREAYARFAAAFLELDCFSPESLPLWFAAIDDRQRIQRVLAGDVDAETILQQTRPKGAAGPDGEPAALATPEPAEMPPHPESQRKWTLALASRAAGMGNVVRAAILRMRAGGAAGRGEAEQQLKPLIDRLTPALQLDSARQAQWRAALAPLLVRAAEGWWNAEGRILYDLQKACVDHERQLHVLDGIGWALTLGRRPLRRPVPAQALVLLCRHLQSAARRLAKARVAEADRTALQHLLREAIHDAEAQAREALGPKIGQSLREGGLEPRSAVERVAEQKLVGEMLDGMIHRGFATMSELRDAVSRNQVKLDDLDGPREFFSGDQLLRVDRRLGVALDGVYHPGEVYLRFFQRVSSLLFASRPARWVTLHLIIPLGGAYLLLEGFDHTIGALINKLSGTEYKADHPGNLLALAVFLFAMVNSAAFRAGFVQAVKAVGRGIAWLVSDLPQRFLRLPVVRAIVNSPAWRIVFRHVVKPLIPTGLAWHLIPRHAGIPADISILTGVFIVSSVVLNSRIGRVLGQALRRAVMLFWNRLTVEVLAGIVVWVIHFFRVVLEQFERLLYAVDEWLRFRSGQGKVSLALKVALGAVWGVITYFTRFAITLLVEPQVNPIKHFPVVTVSHKLILPTVPFFARALQGAGIGLEQAYTIATTTVFLIPGIFGFLAWELKENWRLYRANRSRALRPAMVGSHGETLRQFLRPGFHSGTIPKIFARLRKAEQREPSHRAEKLAHRLGESLEHVRESICHFIHRDFVTLLNQHPAWSASPVSLGDVALAATRIRATLSCPALGAPATVAFEQQSGWIVARIESPGWMAGLDELRAGTLSWALLGLYKLSGVDIVREQVDALFAPRPAHWELRKGELIVWPGEGFGEEIAYDLREERMRPQIRRADNGLNPPALDAKLILFRHVDAEWNAWVRIWDGLVAPPPLPRNTRVLPTTHDPAGVGQESLAERV